MRQLLTAMTCLTWCALTVLAQADEKKVMIDPSGTWRWSIEINGNSIDNVLKLSAGEDGKLTGTLEARGIKMDVQEGKVSGNDVSFQIQVELEQKITVRFEGKIEADKIEGELRAKGDGEEREFPWEATRSVQAADVVGAWQLKIVTPDGETLEPVLTITEKGKVLGATYVINDKMVEVTELKLKDNQLSFEVDSEYHGSPLHVAYKGKPQGSKLKGSLEYSVDGNSGQLEFTGMLKEKK